MKCLNCNEELPEGLVSCPKCGTSINPTNQPALVAEPVVPDTPAQPVPAPVVPDVPVQPAPVQPVPETQVPAPMPEVAPAAPNVAPAPMAAPVVDAPVQPAPAEPTPVAPMPAPSTPVAPVTPEPQQAVNPGVVQQPQIMGLPQMAPVEPKKPNKILELIKKYKLYIGIALGVIIIAIVLISVLGNSTSKDAAGLIYAENNPIIIEKDGKMGAINKKGKVIIEPQYEELSYFLGDYALGVKDLDNTSADDYFEIINTKGKVIKTGKSYDLDLDAEHGIWVIEGKLFNQNLKQLTPDNIRVDLDDEGYLTYRDTDSDETGIMNSKGKVIYKSKNTDVSSLDISENEYSDKELFAIVSDYINDKRTEYIISLKSGKKVYDLPDPEDYLILSDDNGLFYYYPNDHYEEKKYLYFYNGKLAYEVSKVDEVSVYDYNNQILEVDYGYDYEELGKKQRKYYYDVKNKELLDKYEGSSEENNLLEELYGYTTYSANSKYGLMKDKTVVIEAKYDDLLFPDKTTYDYLKDKKGIEVAVLIEDDSATLINIKNQKELFKFNTDSMYTKGTFVYGKIYDKDSYDVKEYIIYNILSGKNITIDKADDITFTPNSVEVENNNKTAYYNIDLEKVYEN